MTLDTTAQVRLRISDRLRYGEETRVGDGTAVLFKLQQGAPAASVSAVSAYVPVAAGWSATGCTVDTGMSTVTFSSLIPANTFFRVDYKWAVFSDDELGQFLSDGGSVPAAALQAVKTLMFDGLRRGKWASPDGTDYDDSAALKALTDLYSAIWAELRETPQGGFQSWTQEQRYWNGEYNA